ncbi:hypothetical protein FOCC_FOCC012157, partial [Frankliniella occidentalis]
LLSGVRKLANNLGQSQSQPHHQNGRSPTSSAEEPETDGKVKTKLMSMWNNMKYGWTVKVKTNFSKDSPVWLLGRCYHPVDHHPLDDTQAIACSEDMLGVFVEEEGIEAFRSDFQSRLWLTYRREFPILNGSNFTTDCGWGCMLRSGQMLLAQALVCHFINRDWRWRPEEPLTTGLMNRNDKMHRAIIKWFADIPSPVSPFSIHTLVRLGEESGKKAGDWYGPGSVAHLLRMAVKAAAEEYDEFEKLCVYVAQDCAVYVQDIIDLCEKHENGGSRKYWKSVIILVPVRLGGEKMNSIYAPCLTSLLTLKHCIGIIGGRPRHSLYFVGYQDDKLIHLDPHYCQERVDVWQPNFPLSSFHCRSPRKMHLSKMDPSCSIGFYCKTRDDLDAFVQDVKKCLVPPNQKSEYPMFVFCDGRSRDAVSLPRLSIPEDDNAIGFDSDNYMECEEFEIL